MYGCHYACIKLIRYKNGRLLASLSFPQGFKNIAALQKKKFSFSEMLSFNGVCTSYDSNIFRMNTSNTSMQNMTTAGDNVMFYLTVYGCLAGANSIFTLFRAFLFAYGGICAAQTIHRKLLNNMLKVKNDWITFPFVLYLGYQTVL